MSKEQQSATGRLARGIFKPKEWSSYEMMREITEYLIEGFMRLFVLRKESQSEQLDQVMHRYSLSEKDILARKRVFFRMALLMLLVSVAVFSYTMYHLLYAHYRAVMLSSVVFLLSLTVAFRYHFWYFQLKKRKLGCSFKEWLRSGLLGADE